MISLRQKKGQGVDLREMGEASITRTTDIRFDEHKQQFYIVILTGRLANTVVCNELGVPLYFDDYEDAVDYEIEMVQASRQRKLGLM